MSVIKFPGAETPTFEQLMRNPQRDRADFTIAAVIQGLLDEGISRGMITRTLFDHLVEQLQTTPEGRDATEAENAEHIAILNEIDARWMNLRGALATHDPDLFKTPR